MDQTIQYHKSFRGWFRKNASQIELGCYQVPKLSVQFQKQTYGTLQLTASITNIQTTATEHLFSDWSIPDYMFRKFVPFQDSILRRSHFTEQ